MISGGGKVMGFELDEARDVCDGWFLFGVMERIGLFGHICVCWLLYCHRSYVPTLWRFVV